MFGYLQNVYSINNHFANSIPGVLASSQDLINCCNNSAKNNTDKSFNLKTVDVEIISTLFWCD